VWPRRFWARVGRRLIRSEFVDDYDANRQGHRLYAYLDSRTALTTLHDGQLIFVDPLDEHLTPSIVAYGRWESWIERTIRRLLKPGDRVIEVGANVGYYTLIMGALIGPSGRLDAFEANPQMARLLRRSVVCSGRVGAVTVHEKIVADRSGAMQLYVSARAGGAGNLVEHGWNIGDDTEVVECEAVRLDDVFEGQSVDFIRIDTEGAELLILNGALDLLRRSPSVKLCIEWSVGMMGLRGDLPGLVTSLDEMGFRFWRVELEGVTPMTLAELLAAPNCEVVIARSLDLAKAV
jgi:FkbM family methyltransferase